MSFLWRYFQKKPEDDFETVLSNLAADIQKRQTKLSEIRLRERRATLLVTLYTFAAWGIYVATWYIGFLGVHEKNSAARIVRTVPVFVGPIIILFVRRIVQIWYTRRGDIEEKTLKELVKQQRLKVEEIKKKTNYYSTRDLLQKYDEVSATPMRGAPMTPQRGPITPVTPNTFQTPINPNAQQRRSPNVAGPAMIPPVQNGPVRKQWFDKLADAVLGDDDTARYALICEKCFSHNGLVKESVWEETQYVCPKCKHFNASQRLKKQGGSKTAATTPVTPAFPRSPLPQRSALSPIVAKPQAPAPKTPRSPSEEMEVDSDSS